MTTLPTTPTREEGGAKDSAEDLFYVTRQHIGWLKMFVIDMTSANWRDMRDRCEQQLNWLSDEINSHSTLTEENARLKERVRVLEGELKKIRSVIPMNFLIAHDTPGATGPTDALDLVGAIRSLVHNARKWEARVRSALHTTPEVGGIQMTTARLVPDLPGFKNAPLIKEPQPHER